MKNEDTTTNTRREILAGLGLATLGLASLNKVWDAMRAEQQTELVTTLSSHAANNSGFPNVSLVTHEGEIVRFYDDLIRNKVVAINMMYTQCAGICPVATANLLRVQDLLGLRAGRDIFMYSLTLQPELDTPATLKRYAERHGIQPGWKLLTGMPEDIELLRYSLGFFDRDAEVDDIKENHTGMVRIGNDALGRWSMAPSLAEPSQILATINHLDPKVVHTYTSTHS